MSKQTSTVCFYAFWLVLDVFFLVLPPYRGWPAYLADLVLLVGAVRAARGLYRGLKNSKESE